jgi:ABC-type phosphate transport system substrate-binding protein
MMHPIFILAGFLGLLASAAPVALAKDVVVIANSGVSATDADIREIYTGEKQVAGSVKLAPADNASLQGDFLSKVVKMEAAKYNAMWTKKSFRDGVAVPPVKGSDAEVAVYVKSTPGAIGYVSAPVDGVKVLGKF